ncbi:MAG: hypothetical protein K2P81_04470 [Bacteriovoracaceae bacterium]|nr:hypothetical protein [Bacteriovoracaceae bacterium]
MKKNNQKGQSTIEFILTFMFGLGIVFLFVNVAMNYSVGYLVHYATFMASRTYLTVESHSVDPGQSHAIASQSALTTFQRFKIQSLGIPSDSIKSPGASDDGFHINPFHTVSSGDAALFVGAYTVFERPLSFFQSVAGGTIAKHVSESYLGKEPVRTECWQRTCQAIVLSITGSTGTCTDQSDMTVFDNGC